MAASGKRALSGATCPRGGTQAFSVVIDIFHLGGLPSHVAAGPSSRDVDRHASRRRVSFLGGVG